MNWTGKSHIFSKIVISGYPGGWATPSSTALVIISDESPPGIVLLLELKNTFKKFSGNTGFPDRKINIFPILWYKMDTSYKKRQIEKKIKNIKFGPHWVAVYNFQLGL